MTSIINLDKVKSLVYTEKSNAYALIRKYTFEVDAGCNKKEIKSLIKKIYNVDVVRVNVMNVGSKNKRFKGILGETGSFKKAIVSLKKDQTINFGL